VVFGVWVLGYELPKTPEQDQDLSTAEIVFNALTLIPSLAVVVLPPLWFGRRLGNELAQRRHSRASTA
jgi:hypothetical protein